MKTGLIDLIETHVVCTCMDYIQMTSSFWSVCGCHACVIQHCSKLFELMNTTVLEYPFPHMTKVYICLTQIAQEKF